MIALIFALICLIWGSTWVVIKIGLVGVPPFLSAGLRFVLSAAIVGIPLLWRRQPLALTRDDRICILSLGILIFWLDYACVYWAELYISSGLTAVLFSTMPLMTALMSAYWTRSEKLSARKIAGIVVGMAGTVLLFAPTGSLGLMPVLGMLSALAASVCAAINLVMLKRHGRHSDPFVLNFFGMSLGAVCLLLMSAALESWTAITWTTANVSAIVYLAVFGSVVAFTAYYWLIKRIDATVVSLAALIIPIVALVLGWALLGETITGTTVIGVITILAGVGAAVVPGRRSV